MTKYQRLINSANFLVKVSTDEEIFMKKSDKVELQDTLSRLQSQIDAINDAMAHRIENLLDEDDTVGMLEVPDESITDMMRVISSCKYLLIGSTGGSTIGSGGAEDNTDNLEEILRLWETRIEMIKRLIDLRDLLGDRGNTNLNEISPKTFREEVIRFIEEIKSYQRTGDAKDVKELNDDVVSFEFRLLLNDIAKGNSINQVNGLYKELIYMRGQIGKQGDNLKAVLNKRDRIMYQVIRVMINRNELVSVFNLILQYLKEESSNISTTDGNNLGNNLKKICVIIGVVMILNQSNKGIDEDQSLVQKNVTIFPLLKELLPTDKDNITKLVAAINARRVTLPDVVLSLSGCTARLCAI